MKQTRQLNQSQLDLLHVLYRFRFATRSLLSGYFQKPNNTSLYSKVTILEKHGYIGSRYDKSYKLAGREAEYYITPKGVRALREADVTDITDYDISASYKDKTVSEQYVRQIILLFAFRNLLVTTHPKLKYFTARDIQHLDYFPKKKPTAFLSLKIGDETKRFFLEYIPAHTSTGSIKGKLRHYSQYFDEDAWGVTETDFPAILFVAEDGMTEQGVRWHIKREQFKADTDIRYFTTTKKALLSTAQAGGNIWTDMEDKDDLMTLDTLT